MLTNDRQITISAAGSRKATQWPARTLFVSEFYEKLSIPARSTETLAEYLKLPKSKQDELKDVGGYVAGTLQGNRRKASNVLGRDIITLDLDNIPSGGTQDVLKRIEGLGCSYVIYSTRKHEETKPRLRVLIPLNRTVKADEYEPIARKLGALIGIELCDPSTFEASRLMYLPSCCKDSRYIYQFGDKPFLDADGVLKMYIDWRNVLEWPEVPGTQQAHVKSANKQADPTTKSGVVGAFCKTYDIYRAIETFLQGVYEPCDDDSGRYTFTGGSTIGGAIIYDNGNFLYSHHATDPAGGKLNNSFDVVRLHKYGELDDDAKPETPINVLPSYKAMLGFAVKDTYVAAIINQERYEKATQEFATAPEDTVNWMNKLQVSLSTGAPAKTIDNALIVLENDPLLKGKIAFNEFAKTIEVTGSLPWDKREGHRKWVSFDDAGLAHYIEHTHLLKNYKDIDIAFTLCAKRHSFNPINDYLTSLTWDGVKRVDTILVDYLGAIDTPYCRAVIRKSLAAAVARIMTPGIKYDTMPILSGPQGIGKSTFLRLLGRDGFSDSLTTFEGKEAAEMIQGTWINEIGELNGMSRSEINSVKQFLSKVEDLFRAPYEKRVEHYKRQCIFFGTTNDMFFLRDPTGNRRFWPIDAGVQKPTKNVFTDLEGEVDQIWAEVFLYWQLGEKLCLTGEQEKEALMQQETHRETDPKEGIINEFVERKVPPDWNKRTLNERRMYWSPEIKSDAEVVIDRDRICAAEIWCECFNGDLKCMKRMDSVFINRVLAKILGFKSYHGRFSCYGQQKGFIKQ